MDFLPEKKAIIPPEGGWEPDTYYVVEVAFTSTNVIHHSIFYTGFLTKEGVPGAYNRIMNASYSNYEPQYTITDAYYMKAVSKIGKLDQDYTPKEA